MTSSSPSPFMSPAVDKDFPTSRPVDRIPRKSAGSGGCCGRESDRIERRPPSALTLSSARGDPRSSSVAIHISRRSDRGSLSPRCSIDPDAGPGYGIQHDGIGLSPAEDNEHRSRVLSRQGIGLRDPTTTSRPSHIDEVVPVGHSEGHLDATARVVQRHLPLARRALGPLQRDRRWFPPAACAPSLSCPWAEITASVAAHG